MTLIVIPCRMASKRLPGKPLRKVLGKPLVWWTYRAAKKVKGADVVVASADDEIRSACAELGLPHIATSPNCRNGTERVAEAARRTLLQADPDTLVINWQCDEPLVQAGDVEKMIQGWPWRMARIATLMWLGAGRDQLRDPDATKVVCRSVSSIDGRSHLLAQWFSRAPMAGAGVHIGVYAYEFSVLERISRETPPWPYAALERLEQLAWLCGGHGIELFTAQDPPTSINRRRDLRRMKRMLTGAQAGCSLKS